MSTLRDRCSIRQIVMARFPSSRITFAVENSEHDDFFAPNDIEDAEWKAANERSSNVFVHLGIRLRIALYGVQGSFNAHKKGRAQSFTPCFIPLIGFSQIGLCLRPNGECISHLPDLILCLTSGQGEPSFESVL